MIVVKDGKAYFHQFNSREGAWEYVIAPEKYQQIDEVIRKWGAPVDVVAPTERVVLHRIVGAEVVPEVAESIPKIDRSKWIVAQILASLPPPEEDEKTSAP